MRGFNREMIWELMITEGNKQKRQDHICPALVSENGKL